MLRLLLGLASPLIRILGVSALTDAVDLLRAQFDRIEARQKEIEERLDKVEKRNDAVFHGWELMERARAALPHAPAADPPLPGEKIEDRARRYARHVDVPKRKVANVEGEGDEPPESHV